MSKHKRNPFAKETETQFSFDPLLDCDNSDESNPLNLEQLIKVFDATDWSVVGRTEIRATYNGLSTSNLLKLCSLPFLINIPTERALIRELEERSRLQALCGFVPGDSLPTRGTLWNFRNHLRESKQYGNVMLRILIALAFSASRLNILVPYCSRIINQSYSSDGHHTLELLEYLPNVELFYGEEVDVKRSLAGRNVRSGIDKGIVLPKAIRIWRTSSESLIFRLELPPWMRTRSVKRDTIQSIGSAHQQPYSACNILVLRKRGSEVLLSVRTRGYGRGLLTLPGGKQKPTESLRVCARRELLEETGFTLQKSRPISVHQTQYPGKPKVLSVGVLAEEYDGRLATRERDLHWEWKWYELNSLPSNLFDPSRIAIEHFRHKTFPNLSWDDVEARVVEHETRPIQDRENQLALFSDIDSPSVDDREMETKP